MDDATWDRLTQQAQPWEPVDHAWRTVRVDDLRALLAAQDQAESDNRGLLAQLEEERGDHKRQLASVAHTWAEAQAQIAKLEAAQAQAAPVLAAADNWLGQPPGTGGWLAAGMALRAAVEAWRAAREG